MSLPRSAFRSVNPQNQSMETGTKHRVVQKAAQFRIVYAAFKVDVVITHSPKKYVNSCDKSHQQKLTKKRTVCTGSGNIWRRPAEHFTVDVSTCVLCVCFAFDEKGCIDPCHQ